MFEVVFLGTAAGVPSVERGLPALMVLHGGRRFLVDCGEGTQRQLLKSGLGLRGSIACFSPTPMSTTCSVSVAWSPPWRCSRRAAASRSTAARPLWARCAAS